MTMGCSFSSSTTSAPVAPMPAVQPASADSAHPPVYNAAKADSKHSTPRPLVLCGPSGVGKGTLLARMFKDYPEYFAKTVSHTTRQPRAGEVNGVSYHFVTREQFEADIAAGKFIEYANVHGNFYGQSIAAVEAVRAAGKICILEVDIQGAQTIRSTNLAPLYLFIQPPSVSDLETRLAGRGSETAETTKTRLETARKEMDFLGAHPTFFDHVITNDDFEACYTRLQKWLYDTYSACINLDKLANKTANL